MTHPDEARPCTCHPDDRPSGACRRRYAASQCATSLSTPEGVQTHPDEAQTNPQALVEAGVKLSRLAEFMGEQAERENIVQWLRSVGDSKPHGTDWRTYYEIADAIEIGTHEALSLARKQIAEKS